MRSVRVRRAGVRRAGQACGGRAAYGVRGPFGAIPEAPAFASRCTDGVIATQQRPPAVPPTTSPPVSAGPGPWVAALWSVVFGLVHAYWAMGGTWALPDEMDVRDNLALFVIDLVAVPLCAAAAWLALALGGYVRPWPTRRLVTWAGWATAGLLVAHAAPAIVEWGRLLAGARGTEMSDVEWFSLAVYEPWFLTGGILFALVTWRARWR
jgi:Protein of unknown function (DUF3995)